MKAIEKGQILRINCPGYGEQSYWNIGAAKPLDSYRVVVVNPTSILHLFERNHDLQDEIDQAKSADRTSYTVYDNHTIEYLANDLKARSEELKRFLDGGGLLVYFLCSPFTVEGKSLKYDNYAWLDNLVPDRPGGKNDRHMTAVQRGKHGELAPGAEFSPFAPYLKHQAVEWHTLIRYEYLSDGYEMLAAAGQEKCISARKMIGEKGGQIVFLPAPYLPEFDKQLMESIELWYAHFLQDSSKEKMLHTDEPPKYDQAKYDEQKYGEQQPAERQPAERQPEEYAGRPYDTSAYEPHHYHESQDLSKPRYGDYHESADKPIFASDMDDTQEFLIPDDSSEIATGIRQAINEGSSPVQRPGPAVAPPPAVKPFRPNGEGEAMDLMEKMEKISEPAAPEWCLNYTFPDLQNLRDELAQLNKQLEDTQFKIGNVEGRIANMEELRNSLLWGEPQQLKEACAKVLERLGWQMMPAEDNPDELWLGEENNTAAVAQIVRSETDARRSDVARLAESLISFWGKHEVEPKGILITSTWADMPPDARTNPDYSDSLNEFAAKRHICLVSSWQLLCIWKDLEVGSFTPEEIRESLLATDGRLPGYSLEYDPNVDHEAKAEEASAQASAPSA